MELTDVRPVLPPATARRIDRAYSATRRSKRTLRRHLEPPRDLDKYYQELGKLRKQVDEFTRLLVGALKCAGYNTCTYSKSHWLMIDMEVLVDIKGYTFMVWSFDKPQYATLLEANSYYNYPPAIYPYTDTSSDDSTVPTIVIYTVQKLVATLCTITTVVRDYEIGIEQCRLCHYSTEDGYYCGHGLTPTGSCTQYRPPTSIDVPTNDRDPPCYTRSATASS